VNWLIVSSGYVVFFRRLILAVGHFYFIFNPRCSELGWQVAFACLTKRPMELKWEDNRCDLEIR